MYTHLSLTIFGAKIYQICNFISEFNKVFRFLLCIIDIYSKHAWVISLKDTKGITINNTFQLGFDKSYHKPNKIWVDKDSKFYNRSMKS